LTVLVCAVLGSACAFSEEEQLDGFGPYDARDDARDSLPDPGEEAGSNRPGRGV